jgi:predicted enzyme involved in methoxymalonyl-ACP biosynthesis
MQIETQQYRSAVLAAAQMRLNIVEMERPSAADFAALADFLGDSSKYHSSLRRWKKAELKHFFENDGRIFTASAKDIFRDHGLVVVVLVAGITIEHWTISGSVSGMDVDIAVMARVLPTLALYLQDDAVLTVATSGIADHYRKTLVDVGFQTSDGDLWRWFHTDLSVPRHLQIS